MPASDASVQRDGDALVFTGALDAFDDVLIPPRDFAGSLDPARYFGDLDFGAVGGDGELGRGREIERERDWPGRLFSFRARAFHSGSGFRCRPRFRPP